MEFNEEDQVYTYPCPCGDKFEIYVVMCWLFLNLKFINVKMFNFILLQDDLRDGEDIARCPSCSLMLRVIYEPDDFADEDEEETTYEIDQSIVVSWRRYKTSVHNLCIYILHNLIYIFSLELPNQKYKLS